MSTHFADSADLRTSLNRLVRDSLGPVLAGVAILHLLFIPVEIVLPPFGVFGRGSFWFLALATGLGGLSWLLSKKHIPERWAHPVFAIAAGMVLIHLIDDVQFVGPDRSGTDVCLLIVGVGCFVLSRAWLAIVIGVSLSCWLAACWLLGPARLAPGMAYPLMGAVTISVLVHEVRLRTYARFAVLNDHQKRLNQRLQQAMSVLVDNDQQLKKQNHLMSGILRNLPVIAFRMDENGILRESLGAGLASYGVGDNDLVGTDVLNKMPDVRTELERALSGGTSHYHVEGIGPIGFWSYETFVTFDQSVGKGAIGFAIDTTSRRVAEKQTQRRTEFDSLLTRISARLIAADVKKVEGEIQRAIGEFAEKLGVCCGCVCRWEPQSHGTPKTTGWFSAASSQRGDLLESCQDRLTELLGQSLFNSTQPPETRSGPVLTETLKAELSAHGIHAFAVAPVGTAEAPRGFVAFAGHVPTQTDFDELTGVFQLFGDICLNMLGRKEARESLIESETRLLQVMNNSPAVIFIKDLEGRYLFINPQHETIFHRTNAEMRGKTDFEFLPQVTAERVLANDRQVIETGLPVTLEEVVPHDDGPHTYVVVKFPLRDSSQRIYAVCGIATDITDRKKAEDAVRRSETRFRRIFESDAVGILIGGKNGTIDVVNDAFLHMTGYAKNDLPLLWREITPPEYAPKDEIAIQQLNETGVCSAYEKEYIRKDGTRVPLMLGAGRLDDEGNVLVFLQDLTELRKAEERVAILNSQLQQVARVSGLGEMATGIAHELHQPLEVMVNYARGALRRLDRGKLTTEQTRDCFREIAEQSMHAGKVIDRIREFVRSREVHPEPTSVEAVLKESLALARFKLQQHDVRLHIKLAENLSLVAADPVQLSQVFVNLIVNAAQALGETSDRERHLTIRTTACADGGVEVVLADNGPGISPDIRDRLFEQFATTKREGLGLGLAMSRSIVQSHGGELWVRSKPNEGCEFHVTLPPAGPGATSSNRVREYDTNILAEFLDSGDEIEVVEETGEWTDQSRES